VELVEHVEPILLVSTFLDRFDQLVDRIYQELLLHFLLCEHVLADIVFASPDMCS
jgi:hypothetical protein